MKASAFVFILRSLAIPQGTSQEVIAPARRPSPPPEEEMKVEEPEGEAKPVPPEEHTTKIDQHGIYPVDERTEHRCHPSCALAPRCQVGSKNPRESITSCLACIMHKFSTAAAKSLALPALHSVGLLSASLHRYDDVC